ncbi:MAG: ankyrin repeat domain-containing protein [Endomicrobium sp.]|jgi:ankyrin repeat protein|nr:ankyrin repeat domain-containing protein [Endomicrobium sp.]
MKKICFLLSALFLAGFIGCAMRTVIVQEAVPLPAPMPQSVSVHHNRKIATTPLIYAVSVNNLGDIQHLLSRGENVNEIFFSPQYEATPLQEAVKHGNTAVAQYLIKFGANINLKANDKTAIEMAVRKNDLKMVRLLVSNRAYIFAPNILEDSVRERDTAVLKYLLDNGAAKRSLPIAGRNADYALIKACKLGNIEAMRLLIATGANVSVVDAKGRGLLFYAAERNDIVVLEFVYPYNKKMLNAADNDGFTPLMVAAERGNMHGVKFLVVQGAHIDVQNKKARTAVHYSKNAEITRFLNEEAARHKKPAGYAVKRDTAQKYDSHAKPEANKPVQTVTTVSKTEVKPIHQQTNEQAKPKPKPDIDNDRKNTSVQTDKKTEQAMPARSESTVQQTVTQNMQQNVTSRPSTAAETAQKPSQQAKTEQVMPEQKSTKQMKPAAQTKSAQTRTKQTKIESVKQKDKINNLKKQTQPTAKSVAKPETKPEAKSEEDPEAKPAQDSKDESKKEEDKKNSVKQSKPKRNK